jgi:hypothetical protein
VDKIVTAHQPNYIPWIGLFSKIQQSHCFVVADTFTLGNQTPFNRNKIRTNTGWGYLTIPLPHKSKAIRLCDIPSPPDKKWQDLHWQTIYRNYARTEYFKDYQDFFKEIYFGDFEYLWQINLKIILYLMRCFNIEVEVLKASDLGVDPDLPTTEFIISMVNRAGGNIYLSGPSGKNYLELEKFPQNNLGLKFFKLEHPVYEQRYPGFEPNMSAIDLLFNHGPLAGDIIKKSGNIED